MANITEAQLAHLRSLAELYFEPFTTYRKETPQEVKTVLKDAWRTFTEELGLDEGQADVAAIGALLPILSFFESKSPEEVKEFSYLALYSLLDEHV